MARQSARYCYGIFIFFVSYFIVIAYFQSLHHRRAIEASLASSPFRSSTAELEDGAYPVEPGGEIREGKASPLRSNGGENDLDIPAEQTRPSSSVAGPQPLSHDAQSWNKEKTASSGDQGRGWEWDGNISRNPKSAAEIPEDGFDNHGSEGDPVGQKGGGLRPLSGPVVGEGLRPLEGIEAEAEKNEEEVSGGNVGIDGGENSARGGTYGGAGAGAAVSTL